MTILDIIRRPIILKHDVSETGLCLLLQVEHTQMGPTERSNLCLRIRQRIAPSTGLILVGSIWRRSQNPVSETSYYKIKDGTINNIQNCDSYINIPSPQTYRSYLTFVLISRHVLCVDSSFRDISTIIAFFRQCMHFPTFLLLANVRPQISIIYIYIYIYIKGYFGCNSETTEKRAKSVKLIGEHISSIYFLNVVYWMNECSDFYDRFL
jgi:hypothetical protein